VLRGHVAIPTHGSGSRQGLLHFNGRRENQRSTRGPSFVRYRRWQRCHVLCFSYDRLGWSWRKPGERELMADGLAVLEWWGKVAEGQVQFA
jgi:hypothetical protein